MAQLRYWQYCVGGEVENQQELLYFVCKNTTLVLSHKHENWSTLQPYNPPPRHIHQSFSTCAPGDVCKSVHSCTVHNSNKLEITKIPMVATRLEK